METSKTSPAKKIVVGLVIGVGIVFGLASTACTVTLTCGGGDIDCGGGCIDPSVDDLNCGACGVVCGGGEFCDNGTCVVGACTVDNDPCTSDGECCSGFCASDNNCGCVAANTTGCTDSSDCCAGLVCDSNGVCN